MRTPHLSLPLRLEGGYAVEVEQDSPAHVSDRAVAVSLTPVGTRDDDPSFGVSYQVLSGGTFDLTLAKNQIAQGEPEAATALNYVRSASDLRHADLSLLIQEHIDG